MKKTARKVLLMACSALLLVCLTVGATVAYLTSTDTVTNTFTVGSLSITLDEVKTDANGVADTTVPRVKANEYKLIPGHFYVKDPTVHVQAGSEACWVFVKVEDGIATIEDATTIAAQIEAKGWTKLDGVSNVYYKEQAAVSKDATAPVDLVVFDNFKLKSDADVSQYANAKIKITAYAIQKDGLTTAAAAWTAGGWN